MSKVICDYSEIAAIADAVRNKSGSTGQMALGEIVTNINALENKANLQDISGSFNITLAEEMYEPEVNLYYITFDDSIQLKDVINLRLLFGYFSNSASYDDKTYEYVFTRMKTSDSLLKLYENTDLSYIVGHFVVDEDDDRIRLIGVVNNSVKEDIPTYTLRHMNYEAISM